jgi:hypothetical protein
MIRTLAFVLIGVTLAAGSALADIRSFSYSIWDVLGSTVHVRFVMPSAEARDIVAPGLPAPALEGVKKYVGEHLAVDAAGVACRPVDQGEEVGPINTLSLTPGWYRFEIIFQCVSAKDIVLRNTAFFDRTLEHVDFARVQVDGGGFVERLFTAGDERIQAAPSDGIFGDGAILRYLRIGFKHVLQSLDRLSFVFGLILLASRLRHFGLIGGGLALGYLASVIIWLTGIITPRMGLIEALMAFMTVFIAAQIAVLMSGRSKVVAAAVGLGMLIIVMSASTLDGWARLLLLGFGLFAACYLLVCDRIVDRALFWLLPTSLFALMDGFGLPAAVFGLNVPGRQLAPMLIGFDAGALLADALILTAVAAAVALLMRTRLAVPRPIVVDLGTAALATLGIVLFVSRLFSWILLT